MQQQLEPSCQIEIVCGIEDSQDTIHIAIVSWRVLKRFTTLQPGDFHNNKLCLDSTTHRVNVRKLHRWMEAVAYIDRPRPMRCPEEFVHALRLYEVMIAMSFRLDPFGKDVVDSLMGYVRGPALTRAEFVLIMSSLLTDANLRDAAIEGTEARYRDGLRGGFEGVPERGAIIAFAQRKRIRVELGQEGGRDDPARIDTPLGEK